jgi:hypothetical protein
MSESNIVYTPMSFIREYNALVAEYGKLEERARVAQIERITILLTAKALNDRYDALSGAQRKNEFSPDFCHMIEMLGHTDSNHDGNVKALQYSYKPE